MSAILSLVFEMEIGYTIWNFIQGFIYQIFLWRRWIGVKFHFKQKCVPIQ